MILRFYFTFLCFALLRFSALGQDEFGGRIGLSFQFGTHYQKLGGMYQLYYYNNFMQVSHSAYIHYAFRNLGPRGGSLEFIGQLGAQGHWGDEGIRKYLFNELSNVSPHENSLGYSFYVFRSTNKTSQTAGAIHFAIDAFQMSIFNDALGLSQTDDMFRTGAFYIGYQVDSAVYSVQNTLWSGTSELGNKIKGSSYPSKDGYMDYSSALYGKESHGILAFRADYHTVYEQIVRFEAGIDAERIRHVMQNKLMHDGLLNFVATSENPHIPMIQEDGTPYLFLEGQKPKKPKPYIQLSTNQLSFY